LKTIRIGTRKSPLALWQAEFVRDCLQKISPEHDITLVKMSTQGDKLLDTSLSKVGGKGLFIKELEQGLVAGNIDIAVHSTKDMTVDLPAGLGITAICERADPRDAFVSNRHPALDSLPDGAVVGTSSLRRQCQLQGRYPHLVIKPLRGNVNTRLGKLDQGDYDAIILAAAGLLRLGLGDRIREPLSPETLLPAVGQGAICIESREGDSELNKLLAGLDHAQTRACVTAERAMNARLQGGCQVPIAGYAVLEGNALRLRGLVGTINGSKIIDSEIHGAINDAVHLGTELAEDLLAQGAKAILDQIYAAG